MDASALPPVFGSAPQPRGSARPSGAAAEGTDRALGTMVFICFIWFYMFSYGFYMVFICFYMFLLYMFFMFLYGFHMFLYVFIICFYMVFIWESLKYH